MTINENDLTNARTAWGEGMIAISQAYEKKFNNKGYRDNASFKNRCIIQFMFQSSSNCKKIKFK